MGWAVSEAARTASRRYTEWIAFDPVTFVGDWGRVVARELYDTDADPDCLGNLCAVPECGAHADEARRLAATLRAGWRAALPSGG